MDEAQTMPPVWVWNAGSVMIWVSDELSVHGDSAAALEVAERAVRWFESRSAERSRGERIDWAEALYRVGRMVEATSIFRALAQEFPNDVRYRGWLGILAAKTGRLNEASETDAQLADWDQPFTRGANTYWRAAIAAALGDHERAVRLLAQAL